MSDEPFAALRKAQAERDSFKFRGNSDPNCPHCGKAISIAHNDLYRLYDEGEHELECPTCEREFTVNTHVQYSFNTDEQESSDDE